VCLGAYLAVLVLALVRACGGLLCGCGRSGCGVWCGVGSVLACLATLCTAGGLALTGGTAGAARAVKVSPEAGGLALRGLLWLFRAALALLRRRLWASGAILLLWGKKN
jgi:hypothetical protein